MRQYCEALHWREAFPMNCTQLLFQVQVVQYHLAQSKSVAGQRLHNSQKKTLGPNDDRPDDALQYLAALLHHRHD